MPALPAQVRFHSVTLTLAGTPSRRGATNYPSRRGATDYSESAIARRWVRSPHDVHASVGGNDTEPRSGFPRFRLKTSAVVSSTQPTSTNP